MKTTFAIGCLVQWYEIEILPEYIDSLLGAVNAYDKDKVLIDLKLVINQDLERLDNPDKLDYILSQFNQQLERLEGYHSDGFIDKSLTTVADYRREFNTRYCELADVLIWGETDMLVPKQAFTALNNLHQNVNTPKYLATFAICKMWDDSWKPLEHVEFTDKPFIDMDTENWWSLRYTMTKEEMNTFNDKVEELDLSVIHPHKYNGCGLIISSEVIKAGVNIPQSVFFIHEDTAFMLMTQKILGNIPQYHFKNILVVHNRKHPNKRNYIAGEEGISKTDTGAQRRAHSWYQSANKLCEQNCYNLFNPTYKAYTWKDVFGK
jgi:hypothetical protein